ncbi:MAG: efflux RND transporter periplasmic adaptor subunit [Planctomycetota bacterium]|jgi:Cu(I)/Ag(I) efflux system membrane fusion protein
MKKIINKSTGLLSTLWKKLGPKAGIILAIIAAFLLGYLLKPAPSVKQEHDHTEQQSVQKKQVWTCSMHPQIKLPNPGLCPICNMDLIPLESDDDAMASSLRQLTVSENAKQLMDIETAPVERKFVTATVRMVGKVDYDETNLAYITAWVPGRLDRLFVDYTGVPVNKGDHMVSLYSPELLSAQEELIQALKAVQGTQESDSVLMRDITQATVDAAREKLRLWGLTEKQITAIEGSGKAEDHVTIYAPNSGIVIHKNALEGQYVQTGTKIYTIADLSQVWVYLDAYESDLEWLRYGQKVEFTTVAYPGQVFKGTIAFIDPVLSDKTRTIKIRVNVPNLDGKLKPKMFVKAAVQAQVAGGGRIMDANLADKWICPMHPDIIKVVPGKCDICEMPLVQTGSLGYASDDPAQAEKPLVIPVSAALVTGTRAIVYVEVPDTEKPTFEGREVVLGPRAGDYYLVRSGLAEGEQVVTKGNFKIDSSLQILAKPSMMTPEGSGGGGGHDHGADATMKESSQTPGMELPVLFTKQLNLVFSTADTVHKAIETEDISKIQNAFVRLSLALKEVDMSLLTGHSHMLWMEYQMRLSNDAAEGALVKDFDEVGRIIDSLTGNINAVKAKFGLGHAESDREQPKQVSSAFRHQIGSLVESYYNIQRSLAADDVQASNDAFQKTLNSLKSVDMTLLSGEDHDGWMDKASQLNTILTDGLPTDDIQILREKFHQLSQALIQIIQQFGVSGTKTVYILRCPMAFDNAGASWLQDNKDVSNPYFGDMMLKCGSVEDMISVTTSDSEGQ